MKLTETDLIIDKAVSGDGGALETLLMGIQDTVFNLSLRMLGTIPDAEDAAQEILIKIMVNLSSFRRECTFHTWAYRISVNYLLNYKKSMFAACPMDFEYYGNDIRFAKTDETDNLIDELSRKALAEELKLSCTNVMLQCLDPESRCIFIMGTMFRVDSRTASEVFHITAENYRQKLSRIRKKVAKFLSEHCGLTQTGACSCYHRVHYAVSQGRLYPEKLEYAKLTTIEQNRIHKFKEEMEQLDALACSFETLPYYQSTVTAKEIVNDLLHSGHWKRIQEF